MANYYSFLYKGEYKNSRVVTECVETSIHNNYFLHFPGKWIEGKMWKNSEILNDDTLNNHQKFDIYLKSTPTGDPKGNIYQKLYN